MPPRSRDDWGRKLGPETELKKYYDKEYQKVVGKLTEIYNFASDEDKEKIRELDNDFQFGKFQGLIEWARSVLPEAFPPPPPDVLERHAFQGLALTEWPHSWQPSDVWVARDNWDGMTLYHGSRTPDLIVIQGLCIPPAEVSLGDPDYGWDAYWHNRVWESYSRFLNQERKKRVANFFGEKKILKRDIGSLFSLLFVTETISVARNAGYRGAVFTVDPTKIAYFWALEDDLQGESSTCFVMPSACPQALPEAFELVEMGEWW
jgi:hypothetical protein